MMLNILREDIVNILEIKKIYRKKILKDIKQKSLNALLANRLLRCSGEQDRTADLRVMNPTL